MAPRYDLGVRWGLFEGCVFAQCVTMAKPFAAVTGVVAVCVPPVPPTPWLGNIGLWGRVTLRSACTYAHG